MDKVPTQGLRYLVVRSLNPRDLEEMVDKKMREGYRPVGGLVVAHDPWHPTYYCQAMMM